MTSREQEYELGKNITPLATKGTKRETAVISVRLTTGDIARLEAIGRETGKTVSQVVRDAIAAYQVTYPTMVVSVWSGSKVTVGDAYEDSGNQISWHVSYENENPNPTGTAVAIEHMRAR